jgi:formate dehydrogenase iron-sulfur subunit
MEQRVREAVSRARAGGGRGLLLPALHAVQAEIGYIPGEAIGILAAEFNLSRADVHGVITFYRDFRRELGGRTPVRVCRAEACQAMGAGALVAAVEERFGATLGAATADGAVQLDEVFCLGNCALGPSASVDGQVIGRATAGRIESAVRRAATGGPSASGAGIGGPARAGGATGTVFVPADSAACSIGAGEVARLLAAGLPDGVPLVRTGSRGALWLEPLVEVAGADGVRFGFGPVAPDDVPRLLAAGLAGAVLAGDPGRVRDPLALGPVESLPWFRDQERVTFRRVGVVDPLSTADYEAHGGLAGLRRALAMTPSEVVGEVVASGLRGRGGAGFPAGIKWGTVAGAPADVKFVCCNADEGDSGTFADRMLLEGDPFSVIEGMLIAAYATGAREGYLYIRSEYPDAVAVARRAVAAARDAGWLGDRVLSTGLAFDVHVRVGAGAYICGEETSMLSSLEGRRAEVRPKPPLPALEGLFGRPTLVNNVLTLATVPAVLAGGGAAYAALGHGRSRGTQVFQLAGNVARGGVVEAAFGVSLGDLVQQWGGGTASGRPVAAVQAGGPLGAYLPPAQFGLPMDYEAFAAAGAMVGHGGVVVFDDTADLGAMARFAMHFCAAESCGRCTPCRIGAVRGVEVIDRIRAGVDAAANRVLLGDLCELMTEGSLCAMGGLTPMPVQSILKHWPSALERRDHAIPPDHARPSHDQAELHDHDLPVKG